ncbi:hypothetical protein OEA41_008247 [Lepraria neglecta]|uniref:Uncharacterized protein n=1 Tax=Lepraria neglecta TaxID=209136 RepID=A0AAE0DNP2_9LECA|nr:hypothetical protein OEA41_008247 [Lepraria neglecta]
MPSEKSSMPRNRKRKPFVEAEPATDSSPLPTAKRRKLENQQRHRTPSSFWDNLSRLWLTPRALREFDRRTVWPAAPVPPERTGKEDIDLVQLKRFARHGGPSLDHLRAYPEPETAAPSNRMMDSSQSGSRKRAKISDTSSKTRKSSAYDPIFEQHLIDHGIYPEGYDDDEVLEEPSNLEEINHRLAQPRPSLSPSRFTREAFLNFKQKNRQALTENTVMSKVFPIIAGTADIPSQENLYFGNLKHLTDGSITKAKPDFYDGSRPVELDKHIREELGPYIVPSTNTAAPCLPNFFTEGKGPNGNAAVCKRQALYDGALGARGIHELRSYVGQETPFDNNAYTITSTYHGGTGDLTIYSTHPTPSNDSQNPIEYRITQLNGWKMTGNPEAFRQGASALRNARDLVKEKREELIAAANSKVPDAEHSDLVSSTQSFTSQPSNEPTQPESETSADELALDINTFATSSSRTPVGVRTNYPPKVSSNRRLKKKPFRADRASATRHRELQEIKG